MYKVKVFFKQVWVYIKTYWYIILAGLLFLIALLMRKDTDLEQLLELTRKHRELADKEIEIIKNTSEMKEKETKDNVEEYQKEVEELEKEKERKRKELEKKKKEKEKELANKLENDSEDALKEIADEYGWDYEE